ncbi:MAG: DUF5723 family protein [Mangrovibacterium sp.]
MKKHLIIFLLSVCFHSVTNAQSNGILFLEGVPQSTILNPSWRLHNDDNWHISLPALGSISTAISFRSLSWNEAMRIENRILYFDLENLPEAAKGNNPIYASMNLQLFGAGFEINNRHYFTINLNTRIQSKSNIPGSIFNLQYGNWDTQTNTPINHHIQKLSVDAISYIETSLGYNLKVNDQLTIGTRIKVLTGAAATKTENLDIQMKTYTDGTMLVEHAIQQQFVGPFNIRLSDTGRINGIQVENNTSDIIESTLGKNKGFAFDFGLSYQLNDKLNLGFSVIDIGHINWSGKTQEIYSHNALYYEPTDISDNLTNGSSGSNNNATSQIKQYIDDLKDSFKLNSVDSISFSTPIYRTINFNAQYQTYQWLSLGGLLQFNHFWEPNITLASTFSCRKAFSAMLSCSASKEDYLNIGTGLMVRGGFFQFYAVTDQLNSILRLGNADSINFQLGFNLIF